MERAAELRAGGAGWKATAEALGCDERVIRRWTVDYADEWERLYQDAVRLIRTDANNESLRMLRDLLRHKNSKVRLGAADKLCSLLLKVKQTEAENQPRSELVSMAALVEEMSDEELEEYLNCFVEEFGRKNRPATEAAGAVQADRAGAAGEASAAEPG
jgi:hypothetical protein